MTTKKIKAKEEILKQVQDDKLRLPRRMLTHPPRNGEEKSAQWRIHEIASLRLAKGKERSAQWQVKFRRTNKR